MYVPRKNFISPEVLSKGKSDDVGVKLDKTILHIADCILEMDKRKDAKRIPALTSALAKLIAAKTEADRADVWD